MTSSTDRWTLGRVYAEIGLTDVPMNQVDVVLTDPKTGGYLTPKEEQLPGVKLAMAAPNHRYGLFDDMGTGKSLISYIYAAWHAGMGNRVLCVMPPKLLRQYRNNFYSMLPGIPLTMEIFHGAPKQRDNLIDQWADEGPIPDIILTSVEFFRRHDSMFSRTFDCQVIVADEAKWMSNPDNTICKALRVFMGDEGERAALIMNGTPARSDLSNLFGYIDFLTPGKYTNKDHFSRRHIEVKLLPVEVTCRKTQRKITRRVPKIVGYKNEESLYRNLYAQGRRVVRKLPVGLELLDKEFDLDPAHYKLYRKLVTDRLLFLEDDAVLDITEAAKVRSTCMRAIVDPSVVGLDGNSELINTVMEMLEEVDFSQTKVLLAAYYQSTVEKLLECLAEYNPVALYGKVTGTRAEANKQRFLNDPDCKVMVINYESGGVGVDGIQNVCNLGIAVEPTSIDGDFKQTVGRMFRSGQESNVTFWSLCPMGTMYSKIIRDRNNRGDAIHSVVGRGAISVGDLRKELLDLEDGVEIN